MIDQRTWGPESSRGHLCVDTSALFAYFYTADEQHQATRTFFEWLSRQPTAPWRLFVNDYVIDELCSLLARKSSPATAVRALQHIRQSDALPIVRVPEAVFDVSMDSFERFDDQRIPFTDHVVAAHADARESTVSTFDHREFAVLGAAVIPR